MCKSQKTEMHKASERSRARFPGTCTSRLLLFLGLRRVGVRVRVRVRRAPPSPRSFLVLLVAWSGPRVVLGIRVPSAAFTGIRVGVGVRVRVRAVGVGRVAWAARVPLPGLLAAGGPLALGRGGGLVGVTLGRRWRGLCVLLEDLGGAREVLQAKLGVLEALRGGRARVVLRRALVLGAALVRPEPYSPAVLALGVPAVPAPSLATLQVPFSGVASEV
mmetsp:Transcript_11051/g.27961  ORF Transcript_11051/g.27961 Transcript_11051/m.27961 type:complete len:218 (-) Transcript_11051:245-898(-)